GFAPQDAAQQTIFYSLTGLHGAHVFIGLVLLLIVTIRSFRGHYSPEEHRGVEVPGIYWHFVDAMWLVVYFSVYILSAALDGVRSASCSIRCAARTSRSACCSTWPRSSLC